jgi:hypothetical protein
MYVNGELVRERTWEREEIIRLGSCRIGNWLPGAEDKVPNRALRGQIDELAVWNRALLPTEIAKLVDVGRPGLMWSK